jgi:predicted SAM-dependent methyltransferase
MPLLGSGLVESPPVAKMAPAGNSNDRKSNYGKRQMVQTALMPDRHNRHRFFSLARKLLQNRTLLSFIYLRGSGIEIGALHNPLPVSPLARVRYVDRMTVTCLRRQYPELRDRKLVPVDILDDGEKLLTVPSGSQDFVIANHFLEHCQNPLLAMENAFRILRLGGVFYLALPDMRYTFDRDRPVTTLDYVKECYSEGPERSRRRHYEEWVHQFNKGMDEESIAREVERLMTIEYSIHHHVWTQWEMMELLMHLRKRFPFDIESMLRHEQEVIFIIRKTGE